MQAVYREPATIFDAASNGDVLLVRGSWLLSRAGYVPKEAKRAGRKKKGMVWSHRAPTANTLPLHGPSVLSSLTAQCPLLLLHQFPLLSLRQCPLLSQLWRCTMCGDRSGRSIPKLLRARRCLTAS
jgi:hypothetical protein